MLHALSTANLARALAVTCSFCISITQGEARGQTTVFTVHGTPRTCSAITQLDSALSSRYQTFFAGWTEQDYADAVAWADACVDYGWHIPGQPRVPLLQAQHDRMLGPSPSQTMSSAVSAAAVTHAIVRAEVLTQPRRKWSTMLDLPSSDSAVIGFDGAITAHYADTLPDIARRFDLGYEEIVRANPGVDIWLPGEGTRILLPGRHPVPPGSREGVVVNLAEQRLYYFPTPRKNETPTVITYPVSIGKMGQSTPLGQTVITAKVERPSWYPPASVRKEHADRGEPLPAVVGPGPDNPLGEFMMRLGFGDGSYEIHGTNRPVSVGMATTNGCIGMYPEDVAALFKLVDVGTPVRLINGPVNAPARAMQ